MNKILSAFLMLIVLMVNHSCSSDNDSGSDTPSNALAIPTISTTNASSITTNSAISGGTIIDDGGAVIKSCGVIWSTMPNPTFNLNTKTYQNTLNRSFSSSITTLTAGITYYVRAYARNDIGIAYGNQIIFKTASASLPIVTTNSVSNISITSALLGGVVTSDGGGVVSERGVVYSTTKNPTRNNNDYFRSNGTGVGSFNIDNAFLLAHTTYYVRAYARNEAGVSYGNEISFTTSQPYVGGNYHGGVIYYLLKPGDNGYVSGEVHGLIVALENMYNTSKYSVNLSIIHEGKISTSLGSGYANSILIRNINPFNNTAASAALAFETGIGDKGNWYLPSKDELNLLYLNKSVLSPNNYFGILWSSSVRYESNSGGWVQNFDFGGVQSTQPVDSDSAGVRPIQSF